MDTRKCPFCGEAIKMEAKKCRFCGEWLPEVAENSPQPEVAENTIEQEVSISQKLYIPADYKYWGWGFFVVLWISFRFIKKNLFADVGNGLDWIDNLCTLSLGWLFFILIRYIKLNFKKEIPTLNVLPWYFLFSGILGICILIGEDEDWNQFVYITLLLVVIGGVLCGLIAGRQLMKFEEDIAGGIKTLGNVLFISVLLEGVAFLIIIVLYAGAETVSEEEGIDIFSSLLSIAWSFIFMYFIRNILKKARLYNKGIRQ